MMQVATVTFNSFMDIFEFILSFNLSVNLVLVLKKNKTQFPNPSQKNPSQLLLRYNINLS